MTIFSWMLILADLESLLTWKGRLTCNLWVALYFIICFFFSINFKQIMVCHCKPPVDGGLGCGDECLNRMLNIECVQGTCPCGDLCSNQQVVLVFCQAVTVLFLVTGFSFWSLWRVLFNFAVPKAHLCQNEVGSMWEKRFRPTIGRGYFQREISYRISWRGNI